MLVHGSTASPSAKLRVLLLASIAALVVTAFDAHAAPVGTVSSTGWSAAGVRGRRRVRRAQAYPRPARQPGSRPCHDGYDGGHGRCGDRIAAAARFISARLRRLPAGLRAASPLSRPLCPRPLRFDAPRGYQQRPRVYPQQRTYVPNSNAHDRLPARRPAEPECGQSDRRAADRLVGAIVVCDSVNRAGKLPVRPLTRARRLSISLVP